jgi:DNA-binding CsgD family transcriptional regulator
MANKKLDVEKIINLHNEGKLSKEIAEILGCDMITVRRKLKEVGIVSNIERSRPDANTLALIDKYHSEGMVNKEIAEKLSMSHTTVLKYLTSYLLKEPNSVKTRSIGKKNISLTDEQFEILYGSLLGDMSIAKCKLARPVISQGGEQEEYFDYKCSFFPNLLGVVNKTPRYDKRTDKYYNKFIVKFLAHPIYNDIYDMLYVNGVKTVTREYLDKLTARSIAFWFMDDGSNCGVLATNCFTLQECELIKDWFLEKHNIETSIHKQITKTKDLQHIIYIRAGSRTTFYNLVSPYFTTSMMYKLKGWNPLKSRELRETPEALTTK